MSSCVYARMHECVHANMYVSIHVHIAQDNERVLVNQFMDS